ncbi:MULTISPECIES: hypothetical protein [unclassified Gilliamella]|nr:MULTISPECIES: hypothetical protein [unclassified Gilliamella]
MTIFEEKALALSTKLQCKFHHALDNQPQYITLAMEKVLFQIQY